MKVVHTFLAAAVLISCASLSTAAPLVFTIDQSLSSLQFQIGVGNPEQGPPAIVTTPQSGTSDTTAVYGTLNADLTGNSLTILGGNNVQFALQPGVFNPGIWDDDTDTFIGTNAPAQFGIIIDLGAAAYGPAAARNVVGNAISTPTSVAGGTFDAKSVSMGLIAGGADYQLAGAFATAGFLATSDLDATQNGLYTADPLVGTLEQIGGEYVMTVPLFIQVWIPAGEDLPLDLTVQFIGQIVATAPVPEPGTYALLGLGIVGLVAAGRRRFRKA